MLISFTGAQSSGKTTSLNHWNDCRNHWNVVPEVTRKLKRQGFEINDDSGNYIDTQIAILVTIYLTSFHILIQIWILF